MLLINTLLNFLVNISFWMGSPSVATSDAEPKGPVFYSTEATHFADSLLQFMTVDEKLGQLFMVAAYSNKNEAHERSVIQLIEKEHVGGLIFFQGGPGRQLNLFNTFQQKSKHGLLIGIDGEWGLAMRLDSTYRFPWPLTVGAVQDSSLVYDMGKEIGKHCKRIGVHFNFGPVADINTNPDNPIINARSFGEDKNNVLTKTGAYMAGMQSEGVLACAKHFPGHGDTDTDSHLTLPVLKHSKERLTDIELFPYQPLFHKGMGSVMVAHLSVPALDSTGTPSSISKPIVTGLLKEQLGFEGLIITDALNMKGVANSNQAGALEVKAFLAGNDILLFPTDVPKAKAALRAAMREGQITDADLDERVRKILMVKYWTGAHKKTPLSTKNLQSDLINAKADIITKKLTEQSLTVLVNREKLLPLQDYTQKKIAFVGFGTDVNKSFYNTLKLYAQVDWIEYDPNTINNVLYTLSSYDLVIAGFYTSNANPWKSFKPKAQEAAFIQKLTLQGNLIFTLFANPYALNHFPDAADAQTLVVSYQNTPVAAEATAQLLFGALGASGRLPVSAGSLFTAGYGLQTEKLNVLGFATPEEVGINPERLIAIDTIVKKAIAEKATPGAQVLVAKNGKVFFHKAYGTLSYDAPQKVTQHTLYDLASITKIAASVPGIMKLYEDRLIDLDAPIGYYLPELKGSNKEKLIIRDILAHQAGLKPWIPFHLQTMKGQQLLPQFYDSVASEAYPNAVAKDLFSAPQVRDTLLQRLVNSPLFDQNKYVYSDLSYYLFQRIIEREYRMSLDEWVQHYLYEPIGAYTLGYNPLQRFSLADIAPTENDKLYRNRMIHGYVHDQGAAMVGGVAGHAGLFSNAFDLAKLMQLFLQNGTYAGKTFFQPATIQHFADCQFCVDNNNRRGIGFDKPQLGGAGPTCGCVSMLSFGHTGFTGTIAWVDPEEDIVYIFLSNRVHPDAENRKLITMGTRTAIQQTIYDALNSYHYE